MDDPVRPDWLDDKRRQVDENICFVPPICPCDWIHGEDDLGEKWTLARRDRDCYLHGEQGLF